MSTSRKARFFFELCLGAILIFSARLRVMGLSADLALTQFVHEQWQSDKGLPDNTIKDIAQTPDGYLWLATESGLVRFDGVIFKLFDRGNTPALKDSFIERIAVTTNGALWIGTRSGGLVTWQQGQFTNVSLSGSDAQSVTALYAAPDGILWAGTRAGRFYAISKNHVAELSAPFAEGDYPVTFFKDRQGSLWIGTAFGAVACLDDGRVEVCNDAPLPFCKAVRGFVQDKQGAIWVGTDGHGLFRFESGEYVLRTVSADHPEETVQALATDRDQTIWIGTQHAGLVRYARGRFDSFFPQDASAFRHVLCIFEDREGSLWFGTNARGLHRLRQGAFKSFGKAEGFKADSIWSLYEDRQDRLWISTPDQGLALCYNGSIHPCASTNFPNARASIIQEFLSGEMCIGTSRLGLFRSNDPLSGQWKKVPGFEGEILSICQDTLHRLWIAASGKGLHCLDGTNHLVFTTDDGLPSNSIRALLDDRHGGIWIGAQNAGLAHFAHGVFTSYGIAEGLSELAVRALLLDSEDRLWVGTRAGGLNCLVEGRFRVLSKENGLFHNGINSVLEDDQGNIWFGTPNGIGRLGRAEVAGFLSGQLGSVTPRIFTELDGIQNPECSGRYFPSARKTRDGALWFSTTEGLTTVKPADFSPRRKGPFVLVEEVSADDKVITSRNARLLAPGTARLQFAYSAPAFLNASRVRFEHRLDGFDKDWVEAGTRREAVYTRLGAGTYAFRVRAKSDDTDWTVTPATFAFTILTPFYQTFPFYASIAIAALLFIRLAYLVRVEQSRRREKLLERNVNLKTRQLLEEIMTRRKAEGALRELPQRIMHAQESERRRVARELHDGVNQTLASIRLRLFRLEAKLSPEQQEEARRACKLLEMARTEVTRISQNLRPSELDDLGLVPAFRSAVEEFAARNEIELEFTHDNLPSQIPAEIQDNLYRIMQEALNNIEKHAKATRVRVRLDCVPGVICLTIGDNGRGFIEAPRDQPKANGTGWGFVNMRERAGSHAGSFSVESIPNGGTQITVRLPLPMPNSLDSRTSYARP